MLACQARCKGCKPVAECEAIVGNSRIEVKILIDEKAYCGNYRRGKSEIKHSKVSLRIATRKCRKAFIKGNYSEKHCSYGIKYHPVKRCTEEEIANNPNECRCDKGKLSRQGGINIRFLLDNYTEKHNTYGIYGERDIADNR
jgi:hypothetical protein